MDYSPCILKKNEKVSLLTSEYFDEHRTRGSGN